MATAALAAEHADALTAEESRIVDACDAPRPSRSDLAEIRNLIRAGGDPLGTAYCRVHSAELRRPLGQTYTSREIVEAMRLPLFVWRVARADLHVARDRGSDDRLGCGQRLAASDKWSVLTRTSSKLPEGYVELGELCRVHRDAVTGTNRGQTECGCKGTRLLTFPSGSFSQAWRRPANCSRLEKADFRGRFAQRHRPSVRP